MSVLRKNLVMELQVFDDVISQSSLDSIENALAKKVPWHLLQDDYDTGSWSLGGIRTKEDFGEIEEYLLYVLNQKGFDVSTIYRGISNCFRRLDKPKYHQDPGEVSYMFYLNSVWKRYWGAPTKFKLKKYHISRKVYPKPGRLVVFNSKLWHKGTAPNSLMPSRIPGRFSMVFQQS